MSQIKSFGVLQTAKFCAVAYLLLGLVAMIPMFFISLVAGLAAGGAEGGALGLLSGFFVLLMPIFYAVAGFVFVAIFCLIYNLVAKWVGGIEVELE